MDSEINIYRDVLKKEDFDKLYQYITNENFIWSQGGVVEPEVFSKENNLKYNFQFVHGVVHDGFIFDHEIINLLQPFRDYLKIRSLMRVKVNLICRTDEIVIHGFHQDVTQNKSWNGECKSAIFYLNDCNGYTIFEKSKMKVKSESNKVVVFPVELSHSGTTCTDKSIRLAINFVYF